MPLLSFPNYLSLRRKMTEVATEAVAATASKSPSKQASPSKSPSRKQTPSGEPTVEDLPKAIVRRVVKDKLSELAEEGEDLSVQKDALLAFGESARIFIHYLSAAANDICKESKRQTINADDVFKALEEIAFPEFIDPLKASLEEFRKKNESKRAGAKVDETEKKRQKLNGEEPTQGTEEIEGAHEEEAEGEHEDEAEEGAQEEEADEAMEEEVEDHNEDE